MKLISRFSPNPDAAGAYSASFSSFSLSAAPALFLLPSGVGVGAVLNSHGTPRMSMFYTSSAAGLSHFSFSVWFTREIQELEGGEDIGGCGRSWLVSSCNIMLRFRERRVFRTVPCTSFFQSQYFALLFHFLFFW